jgi:hypothetical protein
LSDPNTPWLDPDMRLASLTAAAAAAAAAVARTEVRSMVKPFS